ncbi:MAG: DUF488 family protein [Hyphomicrobiales bacterium]
MADPAPAGPAIFTVGHSTRSLDTFIELIRGVGVQELWDTRTIPRSRANPQFARDSLEAALPAAGIAYRHVAALGGLRKPRRDSPNGAWRNDSFRGYADYMQTPEFQAGLDELMRAGRERRVAIMCAEGNPFRCHRSLVADALLARGMPSFEISGIGRAKAHRMTAFAVVHEGRVTYPGEDSPPASGRMTT